MEKNFKKKLQNIKPIRYNILSDKDEFPPKTITIISPDKFSVEKSLDIIQEKWFVNVSDVEFWKSRGFSN